MSGCRSIEGIEKTSAVRGLPEDDATKEVHSGDREEALASHATRLKRALIVVEEVDDVFQCLERHMCARHIGKLVVGRGELVD